MNMIPTLIDVELLDTVSAAAQTSPRGRKNHNFHTADAAQCHRLLNAIEPGSYIRPHRHLDANKSEAMLVLRGSLGLVIFAEDGQVIQAIELAAGGTRCGVDIPQGCWHSVLALCAGTVFFEAKAGPYRPLGDEERAPWAPLEGDAAAVAYARQLQGLFSTVE